MKRTALSIALGLCAIGGVQAQSNITGSIFGTAEPGRTIVIRNLDTGLTRTVGVGADGKYRAISLPNGHYTVEVQQDGSVVASRENIEVLVSSGTEVNFGGAAAAAATELDAVRVTAPTASVDVSQVDVRTVFTSEQLAKIPIGRSINDVALLAPGVISSTSYSGYGSFGGAAASENAYYINGYAVTNPLTSLGYTTLPYDAIAQEQVLTGGYGAEFGRSTGGVINIVTKRGGNEWKGGVYAIWTPESLKGTPSNYSYPDTGHFPADFPVEAQRTDGTLYHFRRKNTSSSILGGAYVSGPIVKDRLFVYANAEFEKEDGTSVRSPRTSNQSTSWNDYTYEIPRWSAKIDWNITDNHILELTAVEDRTKYDAGYFPFNYNGFTHASGQTGGLYTDDDAKLYIAKYTGYLTDNLTISALYGQQKIEHVYTPWNFDPACPEIITASDTVVPGLTYGNCQSVTSGTIQSPGANDKTHGGRFDVAYTLGRHELRAGIDLMTAESYAGSYYPGSGYQWSYRFTNQPDAQLDPGHGWVGSVTDAGGYGPQGYYVARNYLQGASQVKTEQRAYYLEDRWQVTDKLLLSLGLRNDNFTNYNGSNQKYVEQKNNWAPRIGFSWDVWGDSRLKIFGNAGRYHLALPNNVAIRGAAASLRSSEYFTYTGVNPETGEPLGLNRIELDTGNQYVCPGTTTTSSNLECGVAADPRTVAAADLKAHYQDEYILGMEQLLGESYSWGAKVTYRDLKSAIDDTCTPVLGGSCFIFNPGESATFWEEQEDGSLEKVHYTAAQLDLPKLKRRYFALDLFLEHPFSDQWYGKIEYTLSHNYGNAEGQLNSSTDTGTGGQADVSVTQDWDLPQLMVGANGPLPNNRTHQLKIFGYYQLTPEWRLGGSAVIQSGRPRSCTSWYPTADDGLYNSASYYFCGLAGSGTAPGSEGYVAPSADYGFAPRGSKGETPWTAIFNFSVAYMPDWAENKLTLQADVLNVFDSQVATAYNDRSASGRVDWNPEYGRPLYYTDPRSVRFTVRYDF